MRQLRPIAALAAALALAVGTAGCGRQPTDFERQVAALKGSNGLYARADLVGSTSPSVGDSGFGFPVMSLAGRHVAAPWKEAGVLTAVNDALEANSVWGPWFVTRMETATGSVSSVDVVTPVLNSWSADGYFEDAPARPAEPAARVAATRAGLDVLRSRKQALTAAQTRSTVAWLTSALASTDNPFTTANALSSLHDLGVDARPAPQQQQMLSTWLDAHDTAGSLRSAEDVMDAYGTALVATLTGTLATGTAGRIRAALTPNLTTPATPDVAYYLASAAKLVGLDASALTALSNDMAGRIPATHSLLYAEVDAVGTLSTTYYATELLTSRGYPVDPDLVTSLQAARTAILTSDHNGLDALALAATLRMAGAPDPALEQQALAKALAQAPATVTEDDVKTWTQLPRIFDHLGRRLDLTPTLAPWSVTSRGGRYAAWLALSVPIASVRTAAVAAFGPQLDQAREQLSSHVTELSMREIYAAVMALANTGRAASIPWDEVKAGLMGLQGCLTGAELYRAGMDMGSCDLEATRQAQLVLDLTKE